jgi:hypothetical protein
MFSPALVAVAAKLAVDVGHIADAFVCLRKNRRTPAAFHVLAVGKKCSASHLYVGARLAVASRGWSLYAKGATQANNSGHCNETQLDQIAHFLNPPVVLQA